MNRKSLIIMVVIGLLMLMPSPHVAAQSGDPVFNIDYWTIDPEILKRGEEFDLTLTFTNVGTFGGNEVIVEIDDNQYFTGLGNNPRFVEMGIGSTATATLRVGISNTIETGFYSLPIRFSYHHAAVGGARISAIVTIGIYVEGLSPFRNEPDTGAPQIVIESTNLSVTNDTFSMTMVLHNTGNRTATNVVVNLGESEVFAPAAGTSSATAVEEDINSDERRSVSIPLNLLSSPTGPVTQAFTLQYASYSGGSYSSTQSVPVLLSQVSSEAPRLIVETFDTGSSTISPGQQFRLSLDVANVGSGAARRVFVRLGESTETLGPLAPMGSSNVLYLEEIPGNSAVTIGYDLVADGDADSGLVALDLTLTYEDIYGTEHSETFTVSLQVDAPPRFSIGLFEPINGPLQVGDVIELPIEVINIGRNSVNVSTIEVSSDLMEISNGSVYIGPLDGGTSGTIISQAEALQPGTATVAIDVHYLDSFQQPQVITERLTFEIERAPLLDFEEPQGGPQGGNGEGEGRAAIQPGEPTISQRILRAVLGFFGLGTREAVTPDFASFQPEG